MLYEDETRLYRPAAGGLYRIQFHHDSDASPPWDNEGAVPLVSYSSDHGRGYIRTESARGFDLLDPLAYLSDSKIKRHLAEIVDLLPGQKPWTCDKRNPGPDDFWFTDPATFDAFAKLECPGLTLREARRETIREFGYSEGRAGLEFAAELWRLAGVPVMLTESRGYSQGDWALLLIVAHPEAVAAFGFANMAAYRKACPNDLQAAAHGWGAWCWGGVVGVTVDRIDSDEFESEELDPDTVGADELNALRECEEVDSCWGFYPDGGQDYFPIESAHACALGEAQGWADSDAAAVAKANAESADLEASIAAADIEAARPDMYQGAGQ